MKVPDFRFVLCLGVASLAACSGGGSSSPAPLGVVTPTPTPAATTPGSTPTATPPGSTPTATPGAKATATPIASSPTATPGSSATSTPVPTATPNNATLSLSGQRNLAGAALAAAAPVLSAAELTSGLSSLSEARRVLGRVRDASTGCSNGSTSTSSTSGNTTSFTVENFYDSACTELWQKIVGQEAAASSSGAGGVDSTLTAGETVYGTNGVQVAYDAITGELSSSSSTDTSAIDVLTGPSMGNYTGKLGADCSTTTSGTTQNASCSYGSLSPTSAGNALGTVTSLTSTTTQNSSGSTDNASGSLGLFTGTASAMSLTNNGSALSIAGYSVVQNLGLTETIVKQSGSPTVQTLVISDAADNVRTTVVIDGFTIMGKVVNAASEATEVQFTVDINGNGTVTFSDGSMATITNFSIG